MKLAKAGLDSKTGEINRRGAEISKQAASDRSLIFGSIGPTGELMKPLGMASEEEMLRDFAEQARALAAGGVAGVPDVRGTKRWPTRSWRLICARVSSIHEASAASVVPGAGAGSRDEPQATAAAAARTRAAVAATVDANRRRCMTSG